jgi:hypothetical protein
VSCGVVSEEQDERVAVDRRERDGCALKLIASQGDNYEIERSLLRDGDHRCRGARLCAVGYVASEKAYPRDDLGSGAVVEDGHCIAHRAELSSVDSADDAGANDQDAHRVVSS